MPSAYGGGGETKLKAKQRTGWRRVSWADVLECHAALAPGARAAAAALLAACRLRSRPAAAASEGDGAPALAEPSAEQSEAWSCPMREVLALDESLQKGL